MKSEIQAEILSDAIRKISEVRSGLLNQELERAKCLEIESSLKDLLDQGYFQRLSSHEEARDILIANNVLLSSDVLTLSNFIGGVNQLKKIVDCRRSDSRGFIEDYLMRDLYENEDVLTKYNSVVTLFVHRPSRTYREASSDYITSHKLRHLDAYNGRDPGYIIDLSNLSPKILTRSASR